MNAPQEVLAKCSELVAQHFTEFGEKGQGTIDLPTYLQYLYSQLKGTGGRNA
jgi:hypothetical protein